MAASPAAFIASLTPYTLSMSFTPGPNNLMLASAGARFGYLRTLPHQAGVVLGFAFMTLTVGLGVAGIILAAPLLYTVMKYASIGYILYLAWRTGTAEKLKTAAVAAERPMTFLGAVAFQWINPKGWIMALGAMTTYTTKALDLRLQVVLITVIMAVVGVASTSAWTVFGLGVARWLTTPARRIAFNWTMAALLVLSVAPVIFEM
jgi:threonine/homoserine/homoserine lactone efflux protein